MKQKRFFIISYIILILIFLSMFFIENNILDYHRKLCNQELNIKLERLKLNYEIKKTNLNNNLSEEKYLASGKNAYERIYNNKQESIINLISEIAKESLPDDWNITVKIEEFNKFILLIDVSFNHPYKEKEITDNLYNITSYCSSYLKNIAIFDDKHKCFLFYDENLINLLQNKKLMNKSLTLKAKKLSKECIRYNSIKINFVKHYDHIYIPTIISGESGIYETDFLLDTGASMTIISSEMAEKTGNENLQSINRKSFSTANGIISCPIVFRNINVSSISINKEVAVNLNDDSNILGMDFLSDKNYFIDNNSKTIYLWYK
ncbi:MAG: retroviral-like aspartic protease family protein [FCB group bacterium]|nr:retroviral-like aspartic protease family protein [FCB group bacterium]